MKKGPKYVNLDNKKSQTCKKSHKKWQTSKKSNTLVKKKLQKVTT